MSRLWVAHKTQQNVTALPHPAALPAHSFHGNIDSALLLPPLPAFEVEKPPFPLCNHYTKQRGVIMAQPSHLKTGCVTRLFRWTHLHRALELIAAIPGNAHKFIRCAAARFRRVPEEALSSLWRIHTQSILDVICANLHRAGLARQEERTQEQQRENLVNFLNKTTCTNSRLCFTSQNRPKRDHLTIKPTLPWLNLGRQSTLPLKRSRWGMKTCGGWNKTVSDMQRYRAVPGGMKGQRGEYLLTLH